MTIESRLETLVGGVPPGISEAVALGTGLAQGYDFYDSALGAVVVTFNPNGVSSVDVVEGWEERWDERSGAPVIRAEAPKAWGHFIQESIERGTPGRLPVDLSHVTPFQADVLRTTATIPKGEVRPYGWVANEVARPRAVRAVGSAVARNPIPLIIPCHRVVRADGHIGNYSLGGPHNKVELLEHEGAHPDLLEDLAAHHVRVRADRRTGTYCHPTCGGVSRTPSEHVIDFRSPGDAERAGFSPCETCRPRY
jgi:O-6-methylguanine DNA methyltransferase